MQLSQQGFDYLKRREELRTEAYLDSGSVPTIGYGHIGPEVHLNLVWSEQQCEDQYRQDLKPREAVVNKLVQVPLSQNQYDALVSLVFNIGNGNFANSTLLRMLNAGDYNGATKQFDRWIYDDGKIVQGLINRRKFDRDVFEKGIYG